MFAKAIQEVAGFTRAIHTISRNFEAQHVQRGSATLFFVNDDGYALTCKHVAQWLSQADKINKVYSQYLKGNREGNQPNQLAYQLNLNSDTISEMRVTFVDCVDQIKNLKIHTHPDYDLALIKFEGFTKKLYPNIPRFLKNSSSIHPGEMLCRLGFPFPEFSNFHLNLEKNVLEWIPKGNARSPRFPIEGMLTRFLGDKSGKVYGIEMSTPGLRGQSGGPLFDSEGKVIGMQSRTKHLHLGFDIEEKSIIAHGKEKKVNDYSFIHLGECIHVAVIKEFLKQHQVSFEEE